MNSTWRGLDPESSRRGAAELDQGAEQVGAAVAALDQLWEALQWFGPEAARQGDAWFGQHRGELRRAREELHGNAGELVRRAQMQEDASR